MLKDEQLIGKYIRYVPEITEEIFDKILSRLRFAGFESFGAACDFNGFKKYKILILYTDSTFQTGAVSSGNEISYKDIIGEDKWWKDLKEGDYVVSLEEDDSRGPCHSKNFIYRCHRDNDGTNEIPYLSNNLKGACATLNLSRDWRRATPDEIKLYEHAGKPVDVTTYKIPEVIPEYVECTTSDNDKFTIGKIYKLENGKIRTNKDYLPDSLYKPGEKYYGYAFKSSTKKAYEAQFMSQQPKEKEMEKPKFEVGKWYKNLGDGSCVGKLCGEVTNSRFPCKEYLNESGVYTSTGTHFNNFEKAVEAAYEDYGKYLPDGHPDKITKKEYINTMNIEVGDTVKCVSEEGISKFGRGYNGAGWESNLEFIVAKVDEYGEYNIYFRPERANGVYSDAVTLVKRKEQPKSFEVHDKCNIGDIIVTTEVPKGVTSRKLGDLHQVLKNSNNIVLYYEKDTLIQKKSSHTYRLATPEEVKMYNEGIRNINDVKKEDYKVGDWCYVISAGTSQLEKGKVYQINEVDLRNDKQKHHFDNGSGLQDNGCWLYTYEFRKATSEEIAKATGKKDFVLPELWYIAVTEENKETLGKWRTSGRLSSGYGYCVNKVLTCRAVGYWYSSKPAGYEEITFEQFKKYVLKENVSEDKKVNEFVEGQWYKHVRSENSFSYYQGNNKGCGFWKGVWKEGISTSNPPEWKSCTINDVKELLFDEARNRYPLGCEYIGVCGDGSSNGKQRHTEMNPYIHGGNSIALQETKGLVYANGVWAVVVSKGSSEEITSYDGLKVGDVLPEKIINDWGNKDYNWISLYNDSPTWGKSGGFIGDRYIKSFKNIDGHISFLVSDTNQVYLKAKGFKSFMESYAIKTGKSILEQIELPSIPSYEPWKVVDRDIFGELRKDYGIFDEPVAKEAYKRKKLELKKFNVKKLV